MNAFKCKEIIDASKCGYTWCGSFLHPNKFLKEAEIAVQDFKQVNLISSKEFWQNVIPSVNSIRIQYEIIEFEFKSTLNGFES
jgi:hypothetical protein